MGWIPCYTRTAPQLHGWRALSAPLPEPSPEHKSLLPPEKRDALIATHLCPLHQSDHEDQTSGPMRDQCEIVRTHLGLTSCWSGPIKSRGQRGTWVSCYRTAWAAILLFSVFVVVIAAPPLHLHHRVSCEQLSGGKIGVSCWKLSSADCVKNSWTTVTIFRGQSVQHTSRTSKLGKLKMTILFTILSLQFTFLSSQVKGWLTSMYEVVPSHTYLSGWSFVRRP